MPIAVLRCLTLVKVAMMIASVVGISNAAPTPWIARLAMRTAPLPASPAASEESAKTAIPIRNSRRRPYTSASLPADQQQPGQREQVAADHPLQPGHRQVQVTLDGRDRDVDDVVIEVGHKGSQADGRQRPPLPGFRSSSIPARCRLHGTR